MKYYKWNAYWRRRHWRPIYYRTSRHEDGVHTKVDVYIEGKWNTCQSGPGFWEKVVSGDMKELTKTEAFMELL